MTLRDRIESLDEKFREVQWRVDTQSTGFFRGAFTTIIAPTSFAITREIWDRDYYPYWRDGSTGNACTAYLLGVMAGIVPSGLGTIFLAIEYPWQTAGSLALTNTLAYCITRYCRDENGP